MNDVHKVRASETLTAVAVEDQFGLQLIVGLLNVKGAGYVLRELLRYLFVGELLNADASGFMLRLGKDRWSG